MNVEDLSGHLLVNPLADMQVPQEYRSTGATCGNGQIFGRDAGQPTSRVNGDWLRRTTEHMEFEKRKSSDGQEVSLWPLPRIFD